MRSMTAIDMAPKTSAAKRPPRPPNAHAVTASNARLPPASSQVCDPVQGMVAPLFQQRERAHVVHLPNMETPSGLSHGDRYVAAAAGFDARR